MKTIFNLSTRRLSTLEEKVLNLGFGYIPTPKYNAFKTRVNLFKLVKQLKLRSFFGDSTRTTGVQFKTRSTFIPSVFDHCISTFEKVVFRDIEVMENKPNRVYNNLTLDERNALKELSNDVNIVVKPADKGGGVVVLDKTDYEAEIFRQLNDASSYITLERDPTKT